MHDLTHAREPAGSWLISTGGTARAGRSIRQVAWRCETSGLAATAHRAHSSNRLATSSAHLLHRKRARASDGAVLGVRLRVSVSVLVYLHRTGVHGLGENPNIRPRRRAASVPFARRPRQSRTGETHSRQTP